MDKFIARYSDKGIPRSVVFFKSEFDAEKAEKWLNSHGINNFFFFTEPYAPEPFDENHMLIRGDVGFDITVNSIIPLLKSGKGIILDTYGGDLDEGLKIYDAIKLLNLNPSIGILGVCASSGIQILLSSENRWASKYSQGLIHNPWMVAAGDDATLRLKANDLENAKMTLASLYSESLSKPIDEMLALMNEERFMNADEMLSLGFIHEIKTTINSNNLNDDEMKNQKELGDKLNKVEKVLNALKSVFTADQPVKNILISEAGGKQLEFPELEDESQIAVGAIANIDGEPATGEFVITGGNNDGKTFVFEAGTLTEIKEPVEEQPSEEVEALKAENEELKKQLESQNKLRQNAEVQMKNFEKELGELKNLVTSGFEPDVPATPGIPNPPKKGFTYKK